MHKFICLSICSLFFLFVFSQAKASDDLTNVAVGIGANQQPIITGSISSQVAGVLVVFDHLGSNQDFTVSVSQNYPAVTFATANDCFSPNIGSCQSQLPAGLYGIRVEVSDGELRLISAVNLSQKLLINAQKSELLEAETTSAESLKSPVIPVSPPPATPTAVKPARAEIKAKEESPSPTVVAANPELTTSNIEKASQVKGIETRNDDQSPSQTLLVVLYISIALFVLTWGLYLSKGLREKYRSNLPR